MVEKIHWLFPVGAGDSRFAFLMVVGIRLWHILLGNDRDIRIFQMILSLDVKLGMAE